MNNKLFPIGLTTGYKWLAQSLKGRYIWSVPLLFMLERGNYSDKKLRLIFYSLWVLLSVAQASFSNLIPDEAYYWAYSQRMAWGYFDHPPVIAAMIRAGYAMINNEAGVRLLCIPAMAVTIYIIEKLTRPRNISQFYMAISSLAILHIAGILAVPDVPLLLFGACFFSLYKKYSDNGKAHTIPLLALSIALMLLSKYHGILIVFFTLLSNRQLLRKASFWLIVVLSITLFLPHVFWQAEHGYPSINYHLSGRNTLAYNISYTLDYLGTIPAVFAPAAGIVMLYFALRRKTVNEAEKAMSYVLWGTLLFFLLMSFRGRIEGNWILYLVIPVVCLGYPALEQKKWAPKFIRLSFIISISLIFIARTFLLDGAWNINTDFSRWKEWAATVKAEANGKPVAFMNSYQKAAEYEFYTGEKSFTLNNVMGRKDQYGIWNYENEVQGKDILLVSNFDVDSLGTLETVKGKLRILHIYNFRSSSNIEIIPGTKKLLTTPGDTMDINFAMRVKEGSTIDAEANSGYPMKLSYQFFNGEGLVSHTVTEHRISNSELGSGNISGLRIPAPAEKGDYELLISVSSGWLPPSISGGKIRVIVH